MTRGEAKRRDEVLRGYFVGRDWDQGIEPRLTRELVLASGELLSGYPFLIDAEWNGSSSGRGDLLFADGGRRYAVVEVKSILGSGDNNGRRNKVETQARRYGEAVKHRLPSAIVECFVYTDDPLYPGLRAPWPRESGRLPRDTIIESGWSTSP